MTIKGLAEFLSKNTIGAKRTVPVEAFAGRRVAIDAYLFSYAFMSTAIGGVAKAQMYASVIKIDRNLVRQKWLGRWVNTIIQLLQTGFIPVVVFDGPNVPPEKEATRTRRRKDKEYHRAVAAELQATLTQEELVVDLAARERLVKLLARDIYIQPDEFAELKGLLSGAGITIIEASGEGEALCATLVKNGSCYAAYTQDSDMGAYLTPRVITDISPAKYVGAERSQTCTVVYYNAVLKELELSPTQFVDFCIMCGTDYNDNVPKIGPAKAYQLIRTYGSLDNIPTNIYDSSILNYQRGRQIFGEVAVAAATKSQPADANVLLPLLQRNGLIRSGSKLVTLTCGLVSGIPVEGRDIGQVDVSNLSTAQTFQRADPQEWDYL